MHTDTRDNYLESYEGGLINALLLLKSRAQIARFDLNSLGMAGLDPKSKGWVESVFQATHPNVRPAITSTDREDGKVLVIALLEADTR